MPEGRETTPKPGRKKERERERERFPFGPPNSPCQPTPFGEEFELGPVLPKGDLTGSRCGRVGASLESAKPRSAGLQRGEPLQWLMRLRVNQEVNQK